MFSCTNKLCEFDVRTNCVLHVHISPIAILSVELICRYAYDRDRVKTVGLKLDLARLSKANLWLPVRLSLGGYLVL